MSDPVEVLLNSPRSLKAMERLKLSKDDLRYLTKDELKAKLGNMKISRNDLSSKWDDYEMERKDKIAAVLEVRSYICLIRQIGEEENSARVQKQRQCADEWDRIDV